MAGRLPTPTALAVRPPRRKQRRLDEQQRMTLVAAYREGFSRKHLAVRYDINPTTVDAILARAGVQRRSTKITADEITLAADLYEKQNLSCASIGQRLGHNATTIWNALRNRGVRRGDTAGLEH